MGGGGALDAMNKSLKQNRAMMNSGSGFEKRKNSFYSSSGNKKKWIFKKATPAQLQRINDRMVELRQADMRRKAIVLVLSGIVSIALIWAVLSFFGF